MKRAYVILLIIGSLAVQGIPWTDSSGSYHSLCTIAQSITEHTASSPIAIFSDEEFSSYAISGNGSIQNPYRIDGLRIESDQTCIHIENCSKSFIISNCKLWLRKDGNSIYLDEGYRHAILLKNTTSSGVEDTIVELDQFTTDARISAVHLENCTDIQVRNVLGRKSVGPFYPYSINMGEIRGVATYNCVSCNVSDCIFMRLTTGIKLLESIQCHLINNSIIDETQTGIQLMTSSWNVLVNNSLDVYLIGVLLDSGCNNSIIGNCIRNFAGELAYDAGSDNLWHDNISIGNGWGNYGGSGQYEIEGPSNSLDIFPWTCTEIQIEVEDLFGPDIYYYLKPNMITTAAILGPITRIYLYADVADDSGVDTVFGIIRMEGSSNEASTALNNTIQDSYHEYVSISPENPYHVRVYVKYWANDSLGNWRETPEVFWNIESYPNPFYIPTENLVLGLAVASVVTFVGALYLRRRYLDKRQLQEMLD